MQRHLYSAEPKLLNCPKFTYYILVFLNCASFKIEFAKFAFDKLAFEKFVKWQIDCLRSASLK